MSASLDRRMFLQGAVAGAAALASARRAGGADASGLKAVHSEIEKHHDEAVHRLQEWIRQPSIAAENRGMQEGCDLTMRFLRDAGFDPVKNIPSDGQPGIFATLDAGAPRTYGLYFMYDVKQADPAEWTSPPWDAALVDKPGLGKVLVGRGAVNQKGSVRRTSTRSYTSPRFWPRCASDSVCSCRCRSRRSMERCRSTWERKESW